MKVLRFDLAARRLSDRELNASAVHPSLVDDSLYVVDGTSIKAIDRGALMAAIWRSRRMAFPVDVGFGWARVSGKLQSGVTLRVFADGVLVHTKTGLVSNEPFRLPAVEAMRWELELESTDRVTGIKLAQASEELAT